MSVTRSDASGEPSWQPSSRIRNLVPTATNWIGGCEPVGARRAMGRPDRLDGECPIGVRGSDCGGVEAGIAESAIGLVERVCGAARILPG